MEEIVTILSTREWAITIWGTGFFIWMLTQSEIRKSLWNVIKILLGKNLRRFFLIIALYVAGITMIFYQLPFWNNIYLKDIILWLIFSGISYCVNSIIKGDTEHLKSTVKDNFKTFPIFINYDKQDNISDTTKYEDHFVAENRLIAISKSGRSMDSEDVQNFLKATERGIDVQLFVRKNKDDKISKEFYYLGRVIATGNAKQFVIPNTDKTAVEIEWELETPVREDIYQYIVNE